MVDSSGDECEYPEKSYNYIDHDVDMHSIYGCEQMPIVRKISSKQIARCEGVIPNSHSLKEISKAADRHRRRLSSEDVPSGSVLPVAKPRKRWFEPGSIDTINLGSAVDIFGQRAIDRNESRRIMHPFDRIVEEENKTVDEMEEEKQRNQIIQEKM